MKKLLIIPAIIASINVFSQDLDRIMNDLTSEFDKPIVGKGEKKDGLKHGEWTYYFGSVENNKFSKGVYIQGKKNGVWTKYHFGKYERIRTKELFKDDSLLLYKYFNDSNERIIELKPKNGLSPEFASFMDGVMSYKIPLLNLQNMTTESYPNETYVDCVNEICHQLSKENSESEVSLYYTNGRLMENRFVNSELNKKTSYSYYYGKLSKVSEFDNEVLISKKILIELDTSHFELMHYYPNKKLNYTEQFKDGLKSGKWTQYFQNGKKKLTCYYANDLLHGILKEWNIEGELIRKESYKKGELTKKQ